MEKTCICDAHNDFLTELPLDEVLPYVEKSKRFGVEKICASYWSSRRKEENIETELLQRCEVLQRADDVALLHIEDLWWVKDEEKLKFLLGLKPFSCSLTWNGENSLAGGVGSDAGLSRWGRHCVERLLESGVLVDVAHLNRKSFWHVVDIVKDKIYCSHAGFCGVKMHERNLTDEQVEVIVSSGGFVGLFFFDKCIEVENGAHPFGTSDIVQNLKYFTSRWGFDNLGLGTDFYGIENYPLELEDYCGFEKLSLAMKTAGFSDKQIDKILCQNFKDFVSRR